MINKVIVLAPIKHLKNRTYQLINYFYFKQQGTASSILYDGKQIQLNLNNKQLTNIKLPVSEKIILENKLKSELADKEDSDEYIVCKMKKSWGKDLDILNSYIKRKVANIRIPLLVVDKFNPSFLKNHKKVIKQATKEIHCPECHGTKLTIFFNRQHYNLAGEIDKTDLNYWSRDCIACFNTGNYTEYLVNKILPYMP